MQKQTQGHELHGRVFPFAKIAQLLANQNCIIFSCISLRQSLTSSVQFIVFVRQEKAGQLLLLRIVFQQSVMQI